MSEIQFGQGLRSGSFLPKHSFLKKKADETEPSQAETNKEAGLDNNGRRVDSSTMKLIGEIFQNTASGGNVFCSIFNNTASKMVDIFSPFVNFIDSPDKTPSGSKADEHHKTVKELTSVLSEIESDIKEDKALNKNLSKEGKQALDRLYSSISKLSERKDLQDMDVSELVAKWKKDPNSRILLKMAERLHEGKCKKFQDERLRKAFVQSLTVLAESLDEIDSHPPSSLREQAAGEIRIAADKVVDSVELHDKKDGDENFTNKDRIIIMRNFKEAKEHVENVTNNEQLSSFVENTRKSLNCFCSDIYEMMQEWFEEKLEEEQEERKLCEEREEQKKEIDKKCRLHKANGRKAEEYFQYMESFKTKMKEFFRMKSIEESKRNFNSRAYNYAENELSKSVGQYRNIKELYRDESAREEFYKNQEDEIVDSLPPSSVCQNSLFSLELDLHC